MRKCIPGVIDLFYAVVDQTIQDTVFIMQFPKLLLLCKLLLVKLLLLLLLTKLLLLLLLSKLLLTRLKITNIETSGRKRGVQHLKKKLRKKKVKSKSNQFLCKLSELLKKLSVYLNLSFLKKIYVKEMSFCHIF